MLIVVQNLGRGGLKAGDGTPEDRIPQLITRLRSAGDPDLCLLQEAEGWTAESHRALVRMEQGLDMDGLLPPSPSGLGPAVLYRQQTLGRRTGWNTDYAADETHHGMGIASWDLPDLPAPLSAASVHFTPYSAVKAAAEAGFAASRVYKRGPYAVLGGDVNYPPVGGPEPAYDQMRPYNRGTRTLLTDPDQHLPPTPDRQVSWTLAAKGLVDVAWYLYQQTHDPALLAPTGADDRIDQLWVSAPLAPCVVDYRVLTTPTGASDHHGLAVHLDLRRAETDTPWTYR